MPITTKSEWRLAEQAQLEEILRIRRVLHDLSNVLTGLLITAGLLKHFVPLIGNGGRYASDIEGSADRAAVLVSEVRTEIHQLQAMVEGAGESTKVCDVRPSLGQRTGED